MGEIWLKGGILETYLCMCMPDCDGIVDLVDYFDATYVSGSVRSNVQSTAAE